MEKVIKTAPMNRHGRRFVDLLVAGSVRGELVLLAIARHADPATGLCWPSMTTLANLAKCSKKAVQRTTRMLEGRGLITTRERSGGNGGRSSNLYEINGYAEWRADGDKMSRGHGQLVTLLEKTRLERRGRSALSFRGKDLDAVREARVEPVVIEHLLRPIFEQRRFSAQDPATALLTLANSAAGLPETSLRKACELVLEHRGTVKAWRTAAAIARVIQFGAMEVIYPGEPAHARWVDYKRERDPAWARHLRSGAH